MPLYNFKCPVCGVRQRKLLTPDQADGEVFCSIEGCGVLMTRDAEAPSMAVKETVDNGIMAKKVEIYKDNTEVYKERNEKNYRDPDVKKP